MVDIREIVHVSVDKASDENKHKSRRSHDTKDGIDNWWAENIAGNNNYYRNLENKSQYVQGFSKWGTKLDFTKNINCFLLQKKKYITESKLPHHVNVLN